jgi:hypothetical protein
MMLGAFMRFYVTVVCFLLVFVAALNVRGYAEDEKTKTHQSIDWTRVPQSQLASHLADILCELEPLLSQKKSVLLPVPPLPPAALQAASTVSRPKKSGRKDAQPPRGQEPAPVTWNVEAYFSEVFTSLMAACQLTCCRPQPGSDLLRVKEGKAANLTPGLIRQVAGKAGADLVLAPQLLFRRTAMTLQITAYEGEAGKVLQVAGCPMKSVDLDYLANTPRTNRKTVQWVESRLGQKIGHGECWEMVAQGVVEGGSSWGPKDPYDFGRPLQPDETPFPGDPLAAKNRSHTMMTYRYQGDGKIAILHQNWNYGKEDGRKVGWGDTSMMGNDFWRLRPAPGDGFADVMRAAKARAEQKRAKADPPTGHGGEGSGYGLLDYASHDAPFIERVGPSRSG